MIGLDPGIVPWIGFVIGLIAGLLLLRKMGGE